jgi:hypothetical protein
MDPLQKTPQYEKGYYIVFDHLQWKKVTVELTVEYAKLAEKPSLPAQLVMQQQQQQQMHQQSGTSLIPTGLQQTIHQHQIQKQYLPSSLNGNIVPNGSNNFLASKNSQPTGSNPSLRYFVA